MSKLAVAGAIDAAAVEARASRSPAWLAARRRAAWDAASALPLPSPTVDEDYRRTDISGLRLDRFRLGGDPEDAELLASLRRQRDVAAPDAAWAGSTAGGLQAPIGAERLTAQGVVICSLEDAAERYPELLQRGLASVGVGDSKLLALWNALWTGGCFIHVPRSVAAAAPVWVSHAATAEGTAILPGLVAVLEEGASLQLIESYASPAGEASLLSDAVTALHLGPGSRLDHCLLQQWGGGVWHLATHRANLGAGASLRLFGATLGSRLQKVYWDALLEGPGAEAELVGVCFGDEQQHLDHQSLQGHRAPETRSDLLLKVAVRDQARSVYSGLVEVAREARGADGYVANRNLILSKGAKADSVPRLEIQANDVRCGHGATAGHIDEEQRFYLEARGVPRADADRLIVRGFMEDALGRAPHQGFARLVGELLDAEIEGRAQLGVAGDPAA